MSKKIQVTFHDFNFYNLEQFMLMFIDFWTKSPLKHSIIKLTTVCVCVCVCVNNWTFALMLKPKKSKVLPVERESTRVWTRIAFQTLKIPSFRPSPIWRMVQLKLKICDCVFVCLDGSTWENIKGEAENSSCGYCCCGQNVRLGSGLSTLYG